MIVGNIQNIQLPLPVPEKPPICDVVTTIALKILKEFALSSVLGVVLGCFVATPSGLVFMMSAAVVQLVVSTFFHSLGAFAAYQALERNQHQSLYEKTANLCGWMTGCNFGVFSGFNSQILIHESGHALASLLIYKRPRPLIELYPFVGGQTQFYKTALSPFGQKLGAAASTCFIVASGPGFTLFISSVILTIGLALMETYPDLGKYLITWSGVDFLNHAVYAYSALGAEQWNLSHDFVHLSIFGLHPTVATIGILAMPVMITLGMYFWNKAPQPSQAAALV